MPAFTFACAPAFGVERFADPAYRDPAAAQLYDAGNGFLLTLAESKKFLPSWRLGSFNRARWRAPLNLWTMFLRSSSEKIPIMHLMASRIAASMLSSSSPMSVGSRAEISSSLWKRILATIDSCACNFRANRSSFSIRTILTPFSAKHPNFHIDSIRSLFQLDLPNLTEPLYDVSPDGQRFVVLTADHTKSASITLLTNWPAELKK